MNEYEFSSYGIFSDAVACTNTVKDQTSTFLESFSNYKTNVSDDNIFMGPVADYCRDVFELLNTDITTVSDNFGTISSYLIDAADNYSSGDTESANEVLKSVPVSGGEFVNYYQTNYSNPYGTDGGTIATSGCGPTAMAMVLTYLTGDEITPVETAEYGDNNGYYVHNEGTSWTYFGDIADEYDVECTQTGVSEENIISALEDDKPVIMSMGPGTFTRGGHFIVLTGLNDDGTISVADPNSEVRSQTNYDIDVFLNEGKGMWSFC